MQQQYNKIKSENKDSIVLFRLGDFYEAFNDDAVAISRVLGITLTGRGKGETRTPMAGIPHHALPNYLPKLVEAGLKVAIADQIEEAVQGQLVERQVTQIITSGTIIDERSLETSSNNYIGCVYISYVKDKTTYNFAFADLTTGEFKAFSTSNPNLVKNEINKFDLSELLVSESQKDSFNNVYDKRLEVVEDSLFTLETARENLLQQFKTQSLKGFGFEEDDTLQIPAGVLLHYLKYTLKRELSHIKKLSKYKYSDYMQLDAQTIHNLELLYPLNTAGDREATVYSILNKCKSPMGQRKLRHFLLNPLVNKEMLQERLDAVEFFYNDPIFTDAIIDKVCNIYDIERISGRIGLQTVNPKDLVALKMSLGMAIELCKDISELSGNTIPIRLKYLCAIDKSKLDQVIKIVDTSIHEDPPTLVSDGGVILDGYNSEVDELRNIRKNAKQILAEMQRRECEQTKIPSLKISYNKVFGYYIEVTRTHSDKVPDHYIRKQTLANAERYITQELKELEDKILSSEEKLMKIELDLFLEIRNEIAGYIDTILDTADKIAEIDVLSNFGFIARKDRFVKPTIIDDNTLNIINGRHLVVEQITKEFVPNTTNFNNAASFHILTGPNMSGKSTYIRQVALITLLTQIGSFVPADKMEFGIVDRIFTRVGASDNLAKGESTFMVEMTETANILNNATEKSLVILDEVGRGTSTYDGVAIAWAIVSHIVENIKAKTLFATHYHELIELEKIYDSVKNFNVSVEGDKKNISFTHLIKEGGTSQSYGVHVAKLAGLPESVTENAEKILESFEMSNRATPSGGNQIKNKMKKPKSDKEHSPKRPRRIHPEQMGLI